MENSKQPAFPTLNEELTSKYVQADTLMHSHGGLTKREYFAVKAMQGLLCNNYGSISNSRGYTDEGIAKVSVRLADALLKELDIK